MAPGLGKPHAFVLRELAPGSQVPPRFGWSTRRRREEGGVEMWDRFGQRPIDHGWWLGMVHELVPLLFLVAIVAFGIWAVHRITEERRLAVAGAGATPYRRGDGALAELRLRYARGELDRDEFAQRFRDLGGESPEPSPPSPPEAA
jgi:uncharacterized membrane protein